MKRKSRIEALLGIRYPIIQASMVWLNSAELAAAVSNAGGLGVLGPNAGRKEVTGDPQKTAELFRAEIRKTRSLTDKPFAVNLLLPIEGEEISYKYARPLMDVILEEQVKIVITSGKDITKGLEHVQRLKQAGTIVIHREISPTVENSIVAEKAGVDAIIATGQEAGGHMSDNRISTLVLLAQVTDAVTIPVIAAGGIYNVKTANAAIAAGAEGVYMGTRFLMTCESPTSEAAKQAIAQVRSEDLQVLNTRVGEIRVVATKRIAGNNGDTGSIKMAMLDGDINNGIISVSESAGGISKVSPAKEVVEEIAAAFV